MPTNGTNHKRCDRLVRHAATRLHYSYMQGAWIYMPVQAPVNTAPRAERLRKVLTQEANRFYHLLKVTKAGDIGISGALCACTWACSSHASVVY